jgi:mRNA interferase MazF
MKVKQFDLWIADLNPRIGTETGKVRPVVIIQTDLLNKSHPSTVVCPITTHVQPESEILRVHLTRGTANVKEDCDIMIDQIRAIDNSRFMHRIGQLDEAIIIKIKENIKIILDLDETVK